jgi:hypothetical protein
MPGQKDLALRPKPRDYLFLITDVSDHTKRCRAGGFKVDIW